MDLKQNCARSQQVQMTLKGWGGIWGSYFLKRASYIKHKTCLPKEKYAWIYESRPFKDILVT